MYQIFLEMYKILLKMYLGFQSPFQGRERPPFISRMSLMEQMNHENGIRGLNSPRIECTKSS